ncbi:50S ribosomal protein L23 [Buchnera aphidicola (Mindarus keteleerifoliae)]|uniref:50S ribosomal protein L23 n=1 Tax=Buchnera aphidicola TaxID=9 RepID=UPI0031B6F611
MINESRLFKILLGPHISEKSTILIENNNTVVLRVLRNSSKYEIKKAIKKIFNIEVNSIKTLLIKGKKKRRGNKISYSSNWKKAYVTLKKGQDINFMGSVE